MIIYKGTKLPMRLVAQQTITYQTLYGVIVVLRFIYLFIYWIQFTVITFKLMTEQYSLLNKP